MQSATSFFNASLFRKNLLRFWPLWAFYTLICLFAGPLPLFLNFIHDYSVNDPIYTARDVLDVANTGGLFLSAFSGIFFAMAMFSYLTNSRSTQGFHTLPIRREGLFITQYLSGLFCMISTLALTAIVSAFITMLDGAFYPKAFLLGFLAAALDTITFYSLGVVCMIFTGQILAAPVFYGIFNFLAIGLEALLRTFGGIFLYGYYSDFNDFVTGPLSPFYEIVANVCVRYRYENIPAPDSINGYDQIPVDVYIENFGLLVLYAVVGLVLTALALAVYRRRHSEETSTVVAIPWARPIFKYGVAFCAAFSFGQLIYYIIFEGFLYTRPSIAGAVLCMLFAGLVGLFAAEMLLKKRFRVWKSVRGSALVVAAVTLVFGLGMATDITGYENYIPDVDEVEYVEVNFWTYQADLYSDLYSAEAIAAVQDVQRAFIADKDRWIDSQYASYSRPADYEQELTSVNLRLRYYLEDGSVVSRRYYADYIAEDELRDPNSLAARATAFINCDEAVYNRVFGTHGKEIDLESATFTGGHVNLYDEVYGYHSDRDLSAAEARQVYTALMADYLAGHADNASIFRIDGTDPAKFASLELWFNYVPIRTEDSVITPSGSSDIAVVYPTPAYIGPVDSATYSSGIHLTVYENMRYTTAALAEITEKADFFTKP